MWFRVLTFVLMLFVCPLLLSQAGCAQGQYHAAEVIFRDSQVGRDLLPQAGGFGADVLAVVDWFTLNGNPLLLMQGLPETELARFRQEETKVEVAPLLLRIDRMTEGASEKVVRLLQEEALKRNPGWKGGTGEKTLNWLLPKLMRWVLEKQGSKLADGLRPFSVELAEVAARQPEGKMSRSQISAFLVDRLMMPGLLAPVRSIVRSVQKVALVVVGLMLLLPVLLFRLAEFLRARGEPSTLTLVDDAPIPLKSAEEAPWQIPAESVEDDSSVIVLEDTESPTKPSGPHRD